MIDICDIISQVKLQGGETAASKECPQAPSLLFPPPPRPPPDRARLAPLADFSFRPKPHLGTCSQAREPRARWMQTKEREIDGFILKILEIAETTKGGEEERSV